MKYFIVLLISLDSYYFYNINIALFTYIGALLYLLCYIRNIKIRNMRIIVNNLYININILSAYFFSQIISSPYKITAGLSFAFNQLFILIKLNNLKYRDLKKIVGVVLSTHVLFFYIQFFSYYLFGESIDFVSWLTGEYQRNLDGSNTILGYLIYRASGLYIEPSTYTAHVFALLLISRDEISLKVRVLTLLSTFLSFSTVGLLYSLIYLFLYEYKNIKNKLYLLLPLIIVVMLSFNYAIDRLVNIFNSDYDAIGIRTEIINVLYDNLSLLGVGVGVGVITEEMINGLNIYDTGSGISLLYFLGLIYFITLYPILKQCTFNNKKNILFLLLLKLSIFHPFFWFTFSIFLNDNNHEE